MMVGVPASGKSTIIKKINQNNEFVVLSTDNYIEAVAKMWESTYDAVFKGTIKAAEQNLQERLAEAIKEGRNIIWDQTNLTVKSRQRKLSKIPDDYTKMVWTLPTPTNWNLWKQRLDSRPGKTIPRSVLESMAESMEEPDLLSSEENFDFYLDTYLDTYDDFVYVMHQIKERNEKKETKDVD
jgi:predicted kinase